MRWGALVLFLLAAVPAGAQTLVDEVLSAVAGLDAAARALAEEEDQDPEAGIEPRVAALTDLVARYEGGLATLRNAERRARLAHDERRQAFEAESRDVSRLLAAMQAAGAPTTAIGLMHPSGPVDSARAAMLMGEMVPALQGEAAHAARDVRDIAALEAALVRAKDSLRAGAGQARQARLALIEAARTQTGDAASGNLQQEVFAAAGNLEELALILAELPVPEAVASGFVELRDLPLPAEGALIQRFEADDARPGLTIATASRALVTSPVLASVRYRGALAGYGDVVILELAPARLLILTGIHDTLVAPGQVLPPGAAIGLMGGTEDTANSSHSDQNGRLSETLYVETRADGHTIDPATWFALDEE